jgi:penicillin amidase
VRVHRLRARLREHLAETTGDRLPALEAYRDGVNAGVLALDGTPWPYLLLRADPQPWTVEDTALAGYAMFFDLQDESNSRELALWRIREVLPAPLYELVATDGSEWDAPLFGEARGNPVLPGADEVDLRTLPMPAENGDYAVSEPAAPGSNNFAVAGSRTADGRAIVANDMHLGLGAPNIWFRARLRYPDARAPGGAVDISGFTLPGIPAVIVGSNGHVAWGFTNSYGDWADLVLLDIDPTDPDRYLTPDGPRPFEIQQEIIHVKGAAPDTLLIRETIWGPVWGETATGRPYALRYTAHDPEAVNLRLLDLERARSVQDVVNMAGQVGIPPQNLICADDAGHIAWTIAGRVPNRVGWDGRLPVSWADGTHRWDGYRTLTSIPRIVDPPEGLLWTANNRIVAGEDLAALGDGGYALGARARQIRDGLRALDQPVEKDMLALQLDDRALFMGQWRDLALATLQSDDPPAGTPRAEFQHLLRDEWSGRAEPASAAYRLARGFSYQCVWSLYDFLISPFQKEGAELQAHWLPHRHAVTWEVLEARPPHLLPPAHADWDGFMLAAIDSTIAAATKDGGTLEEFTWGARNTVQVGHPLVQVAPFLARWLAAPARALPGDSFMPRVQSRRFGASERLVVSPGRESEGIFHMPGGQSGHPFSPYFLAGHEAWEEGRAMPLLPGAVEHRLELGKAPER